MCRTFFPLNVFAKYHMFLSAHINLQLGSSCDFSLIGVCCYVCVYRIRQMRVGGVGGTVVLIEWTIVT